MSLSSDIRICGYSPGAIGEVVSLHGIYYREHWNFDLSFEAQVARELGLFMESFREGRDGLWVARDGEGNFLGSIALDGKGEEGARLRWFIVKPEMQGKGVGRLLAGRAMEFCKKHHATVFLWTFQGLDAARALYESHGFTLAEEHPTEQWGGIIPEQKFIWRNTELSS